MKIKMLIAKTDGVENVNGVAFASGSVQPTRNIPVLSKFDMNSLPMAIADVTVEGDDVFAEFDIDPDVVDGLTPALGVTAPSDRKLGEPVRQAEVRMVGLCDGPNSDPRVSRITLI